MLSSHDLVISVFLALQPGKRIRLCLCERRETTNKVENVENFVVALLRRDSRNPCLRTVRTEAYGQSRRGMCPESAANVLFTKLLS